VYTTSILVVFALTATKISFCTSLPECLFQHTVGSQPIWHHACYIICHDAPLRVWHHQTCLSILHRLCLQVWGWMSTIWLRTHFKCSGLPLAIAKTSLTPTFVVEQTT
jgi:hypothetical protein